MPDQPETTPADLACAGAINNVVQRPVVCPRCGANEQEDCKDREARGRQIGARLVAYHRLMEACSNGE